MKKLISLLAILVVSFSLQSQNVSNPYSSIGKKKPKVATVTNGAYNEFYNKDSLVLINDNAISRKTGDIVYSKKNNPKIFAELIQKEEDKFRFLSVDPSASKYADLSPYCFVANRPIAFIDPDGADLIDAQGRKIAVINNETGKVEFTEYAKANVKAVLGVVNSTEVGNEVLKNAINAKHNIEFTLNPKAVIDGALTSKPKEGGSIRLGDTKSDETPDKTDFAKSKVVVYELSVDQYQKEGRVADYNGTKVDLSNYTSNEAKASTAIHEITHATDKGSNPDIKGTVQGTQEIKPKENQKKFIKEIDKKKGK
jgi:hypothetical protein